MTEDEFALSLLFVDSIFLLDRIPIFTDKEKINLSKQIYNQQKKLYKRIRSKMSCAKHTYLLISNINSLN